MSEVRVCLVRIKGRENDRSHLIEKNSFVVGRAQDADLPILMPGASRLHLKVDINGDTIQVTDQNSANGTFVNGKPISKGQPYQVSSSDVVRLGLEETDFTFISIPKPYESVRGGTSSVIMGSMDELANQIEAKARANVEQEIKSAKLEAERLIGHAKREAENAKTQGLVELQSRKQELESELARLQSQVRMSASQERMIAQKEADSLLTEAQMQIQRDYEEANNLIETRLKDAQAKCFAMTEEADSKSRQMVEEAATEASRLRRDATEMARQLQSEALRKSQGSLSTLQDDFAREMNERRAAIKAEEARLATEKERISEETRALRIEAEAARKIVEQVEQMEARKQQAREEYEKFARQRAEGILKIDQELREIRERQLLEADSRKKQMEQDHGKDKLKALEDIKRDIERREEDYQKTRQMRALELSQRMQEKLVPRLKDWLTRPESAASEMKTSIEIAVKETLLSETSTFQAGDIQEEAPVKISVFKKYRKSLVAAVVVVVGGAAYFQQEITTYLEAQGQNNYAKQIVDRRKAESIYKPAQDEGYRDNYTDNVLYMKDYFETKTDSLYIEKWTLRLNDIGMLKPLGLGEEDIVKFIAKETNMVQRLGALRESIDAVYLNEGLERLRKAEDEDLKEIRAILKSEEAFKKFRSLEKQSIVDFKAGLGLDRPPASNP